jgi:hypothetical protein
MSLASAKTCPNCREEKRLSDYYPGSNKCKTCVLEASRVRRQLVRDAAASESSDASESIWGESLYVLTNPRIPSEVKVGRAACPLGRAQKLSSGHNFTLDVTHTYARQGMLETAVHRRLAPYQVPRGSREWFRLEPQEADLLVRATILEHELSQRLSQA